MILQHPVLRTKALYKLEKLFLEPDERNKAIPVGDVKSVANWIWKKERWHNYHSCPNVEVKSMKGLSYCLGRSDIILKPHDSNFVVLIHELTHGKGYGSYTNPHSHGFVKQYFELLKRYTKFDAEFLHFLAVRERLI